MIISASTQKDNETEKLNAASRKLWGEQLNSTLDVAQVFCNHLTGKIKKSPFSEGAIAEETRYIL
jgi:hypothetical protein